MQHIVCEHLEQPTGWLSPATVSVEGGVVRGVAPGARADATETLDGFVVPGLANVHSHAFQRALAGFAHIGGAGDDSFWTWRTRMYDLALTLEPDDLVAIARQLYVEMLEAGFTSVGEFHYLHHARDGRPYATPTEMSLALATAAREAGIGWTLLPVAYLRGGFDAPPEDHQRRFTHPDADAFLRLWSDLRAVVASVPGGRLGVAPHSLRAVPADALTEIVAHVRSAEADAPVHIHVAEQPAEVEACLERWGARPVEWLLDNAPVDARWCLVHATHTTDAELAGIVRRDASVGLCPTTEADLGDGLFPADAYWDRDGRWGIGTDAHVAVSATRELALLEWGQRLRTGRRNVLTRPGERVGRTLYDAAARDGARAIAQPTGAIAPGLRADFVVLDGRHPRLVGHSAESVLDAWIFGGADDAVREVWVRGRPVVRGYQHPLRSEARRAFEACMRRLTATLTGT